MLEDSARIGMFIKIICIFSFLLFFAVFVYQISALTNGTLSTLCKTVFFIVPETFSALAVVAFIAIVSKLSRLFNDMKAQQLK